MDKIIHSLEELKEYLENMPDNVIARINLDTEEGE